MSSGEIRDEAGPSAETTKSGPLAPPKRSLLSDRTKANAWTIGSLVAFNILGNRLFGAGDKLGGVYRWLASDPPGESAWHFVVGVYAVMVLCLGAQWMRKNHRLQYGAIECGLGTTSSVMAIKSGRDSAWITAAVIGGVYLFVRGQDNISQGIDQRDAKRKAAAEAKAKGEGEGEASGPA